MIPPHLHLQAVRLVNERKAPDYRTACSMLSKSRRVKTTPAQQVREIRLPYRDD